MDPILIVLLKFI